KEAEALGFVGRVELEVAVADAKFGFAVGGAEGDGAGEGDVVEDGDVSAEFRVGKVQALAPYGDKPEVTGSYADPLPGPPFDQVDAIDALVFDPQLDGVG